MNTVQAGDITLMDDVEVELIDHMGNDGAVVQAARVSTRGENEPEIPEWALNLPDAGLIKYLMREKHGSPFEHTSIKLYVKGPIFAFREFQRHRIASYNEMSGRYKVLPPEFYVFDSSRPTINVGTSSQPQMAAGTTEQFAELSEDVLESYMFAWNKYKKILAAGHANEVARVVLPLGIMSQMYVTMNLRAAFNFLSLRTQREDARHVSRPQHEIALMGEKMDEIVQSLFPVSHEMFNRFGRVAP